MKEKIGLSRIEQAYTELQIILNHTVVEENLRETFIARAKEGLEILYNIAKNFTIEKLPPTSNCEVEVLERLLPSGEVIIEKKEN